MLRRNGRSSQPPSSALAALVFAIAGFSAPGSSVPTAAVASQELQLSVADAVGAQSGAGADALEPVSDDLGSGGAPSGSIERAWFAPAASLRDRVSRTRRAALELGAWNLDSAARVVMSSGEGQGIELAEAAVQLAPDLPIAHMALAKALWLNGDSPISALRWAASAVAAIPRHAEAAIWFAGSGIYVLAIALMGGGLLCIGVFGLLAAPHAAHDLGDAASGSLPAFARVAILFSLLLVPLLLGEGLLGLAVGLLVVGCAYSRSKGRVAMAIAAGAIVVGAFPVAKRAGTVLTALPEDLVLRASLATAQGFTHPADVARLEAAAADRDALAVQALAQGAQGHGNLGVADAYYQTLLEEQPGDPAIANNAAGVRLALGHMQVALDLYADSLAAEETPLTLFNLSQAYGRAFQVEELSRTLARAQQLDGELVASLAQLQGTEAEGFVVAMPLALDRMWERVLTSGGGEPIAAELRAFVAPGRIGRSAEASALAFVLAALAGSAVGGRFRASRLCPRCGTRICPRCDDEGDEAGQICLDCVRLFSQTDNTDRTLRFERINALRRREQRVAKATWVASFLVPGAAGALAGRPLWCLFGTICFALAVTSVYWRTGVVPDPIVAGASAPLVFLGIAALATLGYVVSVALSLPSRREA